MNKRALPFFLHDPPPAQGGGVWVGSDGGGDGLIDWPSRLTSGTILPYEPMDFQDFLSTGTICEISLRWPG